LPVAQEVQAHLERGPMLIISADSDHTVPWAIANVAYTKQKRNSGVTETVKMSGRRHSLTIDAGWREVAQKALEFVKRLLEPDRSADLLRSDFERGARFAHRRPRARLIAPAPERALVMRAHAAPP
jgi:hypothetical protein